MIVYEIRGNHPVLRYVDTVAESIEVKDALVTELKRLGYEVTLKEAIKENK